MPHSRYLSTRKLHTMSTRYRKTGASGSNRLSHHGTEEVPRKSSLRGRLSTKQKVTRSYQRRAPKLDTRVSHNHTSGELSSEQEDDEAGEGEGPTESSDESVDDVNEPRAFAPSGASRTSKYLRNRSSRIALGRSVTNQNVKQQAGRPGRNDQIKQIQPEDILEFSEYREYQLELFNNNVIFDENNVVVDEDDDDEEDLSNKSNADEKWKYNQLEKVLADDEDDEDDAKVEMLEEELIRKEFEKSWDMNGASIFEEVDDSNILINTPVISDHRLDLDFWGSIPPESTPTTCAQTPIVDMKDFVECSSQIDVPPTLGDIVTSIEAPEIFGSFSDADMKMTGLLTPSSIKRPFNFKSGDADETDTDEEHDDKLSSATIIPSALRKRPQVNPRYGSFAGIRKSKPKTPRTGSWKILKEDVTMSHRKNGELVTRENKGISGTNTPCGIVPFDPKFPPAIDSTTPTDLNFDSLPLQSPTLLNAQESRPLGLFPTSPLSRPHEEDHEMMEHFVDLQ